MIEIKEKPCLGTGQAKGFGCGRKTKHRVYGLGKMCGCYSDWLLTSDNGKLKMQKSIIAAKSKVQKEQKKLEKDKASKTKIELMSADKYRAEYLQPIINEITRIIDFGQSCIATGNFGKMNGGHYVSVGANRTTALNLHNIHIQSFESNHHKSGDPIKYRLGLIERYGNNYFEYVQFIQQHKALHLTKGDMIGLALKAAFIRNELKRNEQSKTPYERIELRNEINLKLGIYDPEFCEFKNF
jgi:hypothetical protein